ncbi:MAG: Predicted transcriptional regulators, partial [uncultured Acidimicrobiales bacterium]
CSTSRSSKTLPLRWWRWTPCGRACSPAWPSPARPVPSPSRWGFRARRSTTTCGRWSRTASWPCAASASAAASPSGSSRPPPPATWSHQRPWTPTPSTLRLPATGSRRATSCRSPHAWCARSEASRAVPRQRAGACRRSRSTPRSASRRPRTVPPSPTSSPRRCSTCCPATTTTTGGRTGWSSPLTPETRRSH